MQEGRYIDAERGSWSWWSCAGRQTGGQAWKVVVVVVVVFTVAVAMCVTSS